MNRVVFALAASAVLLVPAHAGARPAPPTGIHKIRHIVVIMQENRSFDSYFGTYPGADGLPRKNGKFTVCVPDPLSGGCQRPFHDSTNRNAGGPHDHIDAVRDINGGRMSGFIARAEAGRTMFCNRHIDSPKCSLAPRNPDVMGYHDAREIPNYWSYARHFVLQDHMFQPDTSWSLPSHLFMVSGWSARCSQRGNPTSCVNAEQAPGSPPGDPENLTGAVPDYAWTDLTYLLHKHHVSWRYYVFKGSQPDCADNQMLCKATPQNASTPGIWNPLPWFDTVQQDRQAENVAPFGDFLTAARAGTLPAVSWLAPAQAISDHPPALISKGQAYVTGVVNAVSLRVPGLVISPYAKRGYIDHQVLSFDAYLKFIEDDFLHGQRLDPKTDGRPDPRPDVRERAKILGDLRKDFDFSQSPRRPLLLRLHPKFS